MPSVRDLERIDQARFAQRVRPGTEVGAGRTHDINSTEMPGPSRFSEAGTTRITDLARDVHACTRSMAAVLICVSESRFWWAGALS